MTLQAPVESIRFEHVSFRYPGAIVDALVDVSCSIGVGERVLITGANSAGKSTFAKLLAGLYEPREGRITYDGTDSRLIPAGRTASWISCLTQNYLYYDATVRENIHLGDVRADADVRNIQVAARRARADGFIEKWPAQYETRLGRWLWSDGQVPSQGQRVRLALARALFRSAAVYVLDEPTLGIDQSAEEDVIWEIERVT